jgi:DNA-binding CsgD family transcriptional regulator
VQKGIEALTEKERLTLRLMGEGHDAKSLARHLDLSVHTINERLRDARRKLGVSSSREAARLLRNHEQPTPENVGDKPLGDALPEVPAAQEHPPAAARTSNVRGWLIGGTLMLIALVALSLSSLGPDGAPAPATTSSQVRAEASASASKWLALVDAQDWAGSFAATGQTFRTANTIKGWTDASQSARVPLGAAVKRVMTSHDYVPAPPAGYEQVRFRTDFANRSGATETVMLVREGGELKVVGYMIE